MRFSSSLYVFNKCLRLHRDDKEKDKENKREKSKMTIEKKKKRRVKEYQRQSYMQEAATVISMSKALSLFTENRQLLSKINKAKKRRLV